MDDKKQVGLVSAEFASDKKTTPDDDEKKCITRRRVLEAGAAALGLFMLPKLAFAIDSPQNERGWIGYPNGSVVHNGGKWIGVQSETWWWFVGIGNGQYLCVSCNRCLQGHYGQFDMNRSRHVRDTSLPVRP